MQLAERADVARAEHADRNLLLAAHHEDARRFFRLIRVRVEQRGRRGQHAGDHLNQRQLAHERIGDRLEHLRGEALAHVRVADVHGFGLRVDAVIGVFHRAGHVHRQLIHQRTHADAVQAGNRRNRHNAALVNAGGQAAQHVFFAEFAFVEEFFHQFFAGAGRRFVAGFQRLFHQAGHVFRNRDFLAVFARADEGFSRQNIHNAAEGRALADRQNRRNDAVAVGTAQIVEHLAVIDMFTIDLRDGDEACQAMLRGRVPCFFKAGGDARRGADDDHRALHGVQRASHFARKIKVTGNVNEVEFFAVDFNRRHGRADGDMTLDFFGIIVTDRVSILDTTLAVSHAGSIEHRLNQRRFAFRAVSQYSDVAYVLHHVVLHKSFLL